MEKVKKDESTADKCLYAILYIWLHGKSGKGHIARITWRKMLKILECKEVGETALAESIKAKKGNVIQIHIFQLVQ